jgi:NAD(P)-dependent dehydrogenase (short-subunit alcohol dehydrogenase family)
MNIKYPEWRGQSSLAGKEEGFKMKKNILVTGAASGLGQATALEFAANGDHVFACDLNKKGLSEISSNENITAIEMDITSLKSVQAALKKITGKVKGLDGIINVAGIYRGGSLVEISEENFRKMFEVNVFGTYRVTKTFFPLLMKNKGRVVNISSETARLSFCFNGIYSMTKYSIEAYSDALRRELQLLGMKVIIIQPGPIQTPLLAATPELMGQSELFFKQVCMIGEVSQKENARSVTATDAAKIIIKAFYSKNPKLRYRVNQPLDRYILSLLPSRLTDFLIKIALG